MAKTPSERRREGRRAFYPGEDPVAQNPYPEHCISHRDWQEGWDAAKEDSKREISIAEKPGKVRSEGRSMYDPLSNPDRLNPYPLAAWQWSVWIEGWREAEEQHCYRKNRKLEDRVADLESKIKQLEERIDDLWKR